MATWQVMTLSGLFIFLTCILVLLFGLVNDGDLQQKKLKIQINEQKNILLRLETSFQKSLLNQERSVENLTKELNIKPIEWAINQNSQLSFYQTLSSVYTQNYVTQLINQLVNLLIHHWFTSVSKHVRDSLIHSGRN